MLRIVFFSGKHQNAANIFHFFSGEHQNAANLFHAARQAGDSNEHEDADSHAPRAGHATVPGPCR